MGKGFDNEKVGYNEIKVAISVADASSTVWGHFFLRTTVDGGGANTVLATANIRSFSIRISHKLVIPTHSYATLAFE